MKVLIERFSKAEDGNAVIDWIVLMSGMVLLAASVVITVTSNVDDITDRTMERVAEMEDFQPA